MTTKISPEALNWITSRPEGTRAYIERLVADDKARSASQPQRAKGGSPVETQTVEYEQWELYRPGATMPEEETSEPNTVPGE